MWRDFLGTEGGPEVRVSRGSLCSNGCLFRILRCRGRSELDCSVPGKGASGLRPVCGMLASVGTPLGALSPPCLLMGPHWSWRGELQYGPLPSPSQQEERACLTHFFLYCLRAKEGGRRKAFSLPVPLAQGWLQRGGIPLWTFVLVLVPPSPWGPRTECRGVFPGSARLLTLEWEGWKEEERESGRASSLHSS